MESHVLFLSEYLANKGYDVTVLTADADQNGRRLGQGQSLDTLKVIRFPVWMRIGGFGSFWPGVSKTLMSTKFDLIHTHVYRHPHSTIALVASKLRKTPSILTGHSPFHPTSVRGALMGDITRLFDASLGRAMTGSYGAVIAVTSSEALAYQRLGVERRRIHTIPNGIPVEAFRRAEPQRYNRRFFLYLGRVHPTKGIEFLIESFARLPRDSSSVELVIAGTGSEDYIHRLSDMVSRLQLRDKVRFVGHVPEDQKWHLLASCVGLVLPSIYEPFGIVLLEAMAQGKPVIATRPGGPEDIIEEGITGFLVRYGDVESLSSKMLTLLTDVSHDMGRRGRERAKRYLWDRVAEEVSSLYDKLLSGS